MIINQIRWLIASALSLLPNFRGRWRLTWSLNRLFLALGAKPIIWTSVNGVKMRVDMRTLTEFTSFWNKGYDTPQIATLSTILNKLNAPVFLDIGGNIGFYSVSVAKSISCKGGKVYTFEPHPGNYNRLQENLLENSIHNTKTFNMGLSSDRGALNLVMRGDFALGSNTGNCSIEIADNIDKNARKIAIQLDTLDSFTASQNIAHIDIMKIDVEGHEDEVLKGAQDTITKIRPIIQMEVNRSYFLRKGVAFDETIIHLLPADYAIYSYKKNRLFMEKSLTECSDLTDVVFCPKEKSYLLNAA